MSKKLPTQYPYNTYFQPNKLFQLYQLLCLERSYETYPYSWLVAYGEYTSIYVNSFLDEKSAIKFATQTFSRYKNIEIGQRHEAIDSLLSQGVQFTPHDAYFGYNFTIYPTHPTTANERIAIHYEWLANNKEYFGYDMGHFIVSLASEVANIIHLQSYGVVFSDKVIALAKQYAKKLVECNPYVMDGCIFEFAE